MLEKGDLIRAAAPIHRLAEYHGKIVRKDGHYLHRTAPQTQLQFMITSSAPSTPRDMDPLSERRRSADRGKIFRRSHRLLSSTFYQPNIPKHLSNRNWETLPIAAGTVPLNKTLAFKIMKRKVPVRLSVNQVDFMEGPHCSVPQVEEINPEGFIDKADKTFYNQQVETSGARSLRGTQIVPLSKRGHRVLSVHPGFQTAQEELVIMP